jgi:hypothetical protein
MPRVPRSTKKSGISLADEWCWKVAARAYEKAVRASAIGELTEPRWEYLSKTEQGHWFLYTKFVMAALDELE